MGLRDVFVLLFYIWVVAGLVVLLESELVR
jgi:hypothetical protein